MSLTGAITALITPMRDGDVDYEAISTILEEQIASGIDGVVAVGTTGESATLAASEHIAVVRHMVGVAAGRIPVIAGAGANATAEALELTRASEEAGADGLLHVTPYYNKPTQDGLYRHFSAIAGATGLPIVLYNVPGRSACDLEVETTLRLAEHDNIVALKDATGDMRRASEIVERAGGSLDLLSGDDFTAFPLLALGGRGVISVVSNILPRAVAELCDAAADGDWSRALAVHQRIMPMTRLLFEEPNPVPVKAAMALAGKCGPDIRPPLYPATEPLRARLEQQMRRDDLL